VARADRVNVLELRDVRAGYGPYKALNGLTFSLEEGETIAVLGRNGVGKSTLARVCSALVPVTAGEVRVFGTSLRKSPPSRLARAGVVHLPEGVGLFRDLSIEENLRLRVGGHNAAERRERLARALAGIGPLADRRRAKAGELSGGQQRLVAVNGAIAAEPRLFLADEPALGLSPAAADDVYEALSELRGSHCASIIIETRLGRVESLCERALVMNGGTAAFDGPVGDARHVLENLMQNIPSGRPGDVVDTPTLFNDEAER